MNSRSRGAENMAKLSGDSLARLLGEISPKISTTTAEAEDQGGLDKEESQLIRSAIRFDNLEAGDILTPRVDVVAVEDTSTLEEVAAVFATEGYSRLPVYHRVTVTSRFSQVKRSPGSGTRPSSSSTQPDTVAASHSPVTWNSSYRSSRSAEQAMR